MGMRLGMRLGLWLGLGLGLGLGMGMGMGMGMGPPTLTLTLTLTLTPALALALTLASCYVPAVDEAVGAAARDVRHDTAAVAPDAGVVIPKEAGGEHGAVGTLVGVRPGQGSGYKSGQDWG